MSKMSQSTDIYVLIAAAGEGTRFKTDSKLPKQYQNLGGTPILKRTIAKFKKTNNIKGITCLINPQHKERLEDWGLCKTIPGSNTRKNSVYSGLKYFSNIKNEDIILIHDGARPLVTENDIQNLITAMQSNRAATLARPIHETLRKSQNEHCSDIVSRDGLWALQTPQAFRYGDILKAHEQADSATEYTDDTSLVSALGIEVKLIEGSAENIKITTKDDLDMAEKLLNAQKTIRTGLGYDVHAFDNKKGPVRLCGIDIPHDYKLKGHSDADVGLHAITDALLGTIGEGDIGRHFPPSDDTFKNMDSAIFLEKTLDLIHQQSASINNIDLTLICEEPKITPYADKMRTRVADILKLNENQINIKATTSEQLGFTGRKEGIAAQAIATVSIYD